MPKLVLKQQILNHQVDTNKDIIVFATPCFLHIPQGHPRLISQYRAKHIRQTVHLMRASDEPFSKRTTDPLEPFWGEAANAFLKNITIWFPQLGKGIKGLQKVHPRETKHNLQGGPIKQNPQKRTLL